MGLVDSDVFIHMEDFYGVPGDVALLDERRHDIELRVPRRHHDPGSPFSVECLLDQFGSFAGCRRP
jgi:hypothetical protein